MSGAARATPPEQCEAPQSLIDGDIDLSRVMRSSRDRRLDITVIGSGSSGLSGPDGARTAYPARLEAALKQAMPGVDIKVTAHVQSKETTATMVAGLDKILAEDKPTLVVWQAGTVDALDGVAPEEFRNSLDDGVGKIQAAGADVILMNMQYSPRTESMLDVSAYADVMRASRSSTVRCCSIAWRSCNTGTMPGRSTSIPQQRNMIWRVVFTTALAGLWRRKS